MPNPAASAGLHCKIRPAWLGASSQFAFFIQIFLQELSQAIVFLFFSCQFRQGAAHSYLNILSIINKSKGVTLCLAIPPLTPPAWQHGVGGKCPAGFCSAHIHWCLCSYSPSAQGAALCSLRGHICICLCWNISCRARI